MNVFELNRPIIAKRDISNTIQVSKIELIHSVRTAHAKTRAIFLEMFN